MEYLSPGFDPNSLTVPRLRSILVNHDIHYPASAKKAQLVDIFNNELVPKSKKLRSAQARIKRTSKGITDMPSQDDSSVADGEDTSLMPPPPVPDTPRRTSRKSTANGLTTPASKRTHAARRSSSKHARASDTDATDGESVAPPPSARRVRKSTATPTVKVEGPEVRFGVKADEGSPFSDDNPFQSGGSPPSPSSPGRRKTSGSLVRDAARRRSHSSRRKTEGATVPREDGFTVPTSRTFDMRVSKPAEIKTEEVEPGEEFTPEEQLELVRERAKNGELDVLPPRAKLIRRKPAGRVSKSAPWVVALTLLSGFGGWYRHEKFRVGYCGLEQPSTSLTKHDVPDWAKILEPKCETCPSHAICYPNLETRCEPDFVLQHHPLSLGGLLPLPPTCEPDGEKARKVDAVASKGVDVLRERRAKYECGDLKDEAGKVVPTVEIDAEELKKAVAEKRRKGMSDHEFDELWKGAISEIEGKEEVVVKEDEHTGRRLLTSTSLARLSYRCASRRYIRLTLERHRVTLGFLTILFGIFLYLRAAYLSRREASARVPQLVSMTLDRLAHQAALHTRDPIGFPEPWVSVTGLRDDVLRDEFSASRRRDLWERVKAVVELNANVRSSVREGRMGEIGPVWEWIGSLPALEWDAERRRESGRVSFGGGFGSATGSPATAPVPAVDDKKDLLVPSRWEEGEADLLISFLSLRFQAAAVRDGI